MREFQFSEAAEVEVLHSVKRTFKGEKGEDVVLFETTCLIPTLTADVIISYYREELRRGKHKLAVTITGKKKDELKIKLRPVENAAADTKKGGA